MFVILTSVDVTFWTR